MSFTFKLFIIFLFFNSLNSQRLRKATKKPQLVQADQEKFTQWKKKFGKVYKTTDEENQAALKVIENIKEIEAHNELFKAGKSSFTRAAWMSSDLTFEEKKKLLMGGVSSNFSDKAKRQTKNQFPKGPAEVNWVTAGRVNGVRDQFLCGSCWLVV